MEEVVDKGWTLPETQEGRGKNSALTVVQKDNWLPERELLQKEVSTAGELGKRDS